MIVNRSSTNEIGYELEIRPRTLETYRQNMIKLQVSDILMFVR